MLAICLAMLETPAEKQRFQEIYEREQIELLQYARSKVGDWSTAEDIVGDAFLNLAKNFQRYAHLGGSEMHRLLVTIVKHLVVDRERKQSREHVWLDETGIDGQEENSRLIQVALRRYEEKGGPERYGIRREMMAILLMHLDELPEAMREVFLLRHYVGLKPKEIAKQLKIPVKTVDQRLYRATQRLRECMKTDGYEQGDRDI